MHLTSSRSVFLATFAAVALATTVLTPRLASADTILLFETASGFTVGTITSSYGHRVTANIQDGFRYGGAADTPRIVTSYSPTTRGWPSNYGDLQYVAYTGQASGILQLTLSADPGYQVVLHSFDLAGWQNQDHTINSVQVLDGANQVLFSQSNVHIEGDAIGPRHSTFSFPALTAPTLSIRFDASNLTVPFGAQVIGLDNVRFSQVPEPSTAAIALAGTACLVGLTLRRKGRALPKTNRCRTMKLPGRNQAG